MRYFTQYDGSTARPATRLYAFEMSVFLAKPLPGMVEIRRTTAEPAGDGRRKDGWKD